LILQKGTELGAAAFAPVASARSISKVSPDKAADKLSRWRKIVEEAARQCERSDVPAVHEPTSLEKAAAAIAPTHRILVLDEEERSTTLGEAFFRVEPQQPIALVVGPEGGLERREVDLLVGSGAVSVTLGQRVLRTETASLAALAVLLHLDGELG
jgi:16S rRNA (uracil1498-N3)-methyltransferase